MAIKRSFKSGDKLYYASYDFTHNKFIEEVHEIDIVISFQDLVHIKGDDPKDFYHINSLRDHTKTRKAAIRRAKREALSIIDKNIEVYAAENKILNKKRYDESMKRKKIISKARAEGA